MKPALHQLENPWLLENRKHKAIDPAMNGTVTAWEGAGGDLGRPKRRHFLLTLDFNKILLQATQKRYTVCPSGIQEII